MNILSLIYLKKVGAFFNDKSDESRILATYRFISLFITSFFYILNNSEHIFQKKLLIILCLLVSSLILSYLYPTYEKSINNIKLLLFIEVIGNTLLLIPSGGIKSPFIWYSLNTILISFTFLKIRYGWINFLVYLLCYGIINNYFTNNNINIINSFKEELNLLLSFIMIIAAIQVLSLSIKRNKAESIKLEEINKQLEKTNSILLESIDHIKELYQSVNILTNQGNKEGIIKISFEHIKRITKVETIFYFDITNNVNKLISCDNKLLTTIEQHISEKLEQILESNDSYEINVSDSEFILVNVRNSYATYGILGMSNINKKDNIIYKNNAYQLQYLSDLISNAFERLALEEVNDRLLITEEQNRIANEIHDSVLQKLFSLSCGMYSIIKNINQFTIKEISDELNQFREDIDESMKELREKIYGLSWKKSGHSSFNMDLRKYIDEIKRLNKVSIPFRIHGNIEFLSAEQKKALYRIICEGIGNAVRHGNAKNIDIKIDITFSFTKLSISDDGIGFDLSNINNSTKGIGLQNMHQLTEFLNGEINIKSEINIGTTIKIMLPNAILKGAAVL